MRNENSEESYISAVLGQIRWKKARPVIQKELEGHIEEHRLEAEKSGIDDAAALENAVTAMGDPLETGRRLDRLHRPRVDVLMLISAAVLIAYTLALIIYSIFAQYSDPEYLNALAVTTLGVGIGITCASLDVRRIITKASIPLVISSLAGLLLSCLLTRFYTLPMLTSPGTSNALSIVDWIDLIPDCCIIIFLAGFSGWLSRLKRGDTRGIILAISAAIAAIVLLYLSEVINMGCTIFACFCMLLFSSTNKNWKIAFSVIAVGAAVYMVLLYSDIVASRAEQLGTFHYDSLVQIALQNLKDLKLIGYAIPAPAKEISSAFREPFGFLLLHYGILPALLPYAAIGVVIWRMLRSSLHMHDRLGRMLASGAAIYFVVRFILVLFLDIIWRGSGNSIPFIPTWGQETALTAGLLGLIFGLYRRKELYLDVDEGLVNKIIV